MHTQVISYLRELIAGGHEITLLTFEPDTSLDIQSITAKLASEGITWHWLPYHKRLSVIATAWDVLRGTLFIRRFIAHQRPDILHGRVHIPTLMGALARKLSRHNPKLLFDIRGFFPEEYTDAGIWPEGGLLYRVAKRVERWLMNESDAFVVLTEKARGLLFPESKETGVDTFGRPIEVIPCCVDFKRRFSGDGQALRESVRSRLSLNDRLVFTHIGSLGGLYMTENIADLLSSARNRDPSVFALFLTQSNPDLIVPLLRARGFADTDYFVSKADPVQVQEYLSASDIAISFVKAGYATSSRSPTKIPEYLACGLPIIANRGVGDVDVQIEGNGVGVLVDGFDEASYLRALESMARLNDVPQRSREIAKREFDLERVGGRRYRKIYAFLMRTL